MTNLTQCHKLHHSLHGLRRPGVKAERITRNQKAFTKCQDRKPANNETDKS